MRIPIKALKELANRYGLEHVILFTHESKSDTHHVATWGRSTVACSEAADFGNKLKDTLGWPASLHSQPSRVKKLQQRIKELEKRLNL